MYLLFTLQTQKQINKPENGTGKKVGLYLLVKYYFTVRMIVFLSSVASATSTIDRFLLAPADAEDDNLPRTFSTMLTINGQEL